jgi:hypothetical protein
MAEMFLRRVVEVSISVLRSGLCVLFSPECLLSGRDSVMVVGVKFLAGEEAVFASFAATLVAIA